MTWDAILIFKPGLNADQRAALLARVLTTIEVDIKKGVDGGGDIFTAALVTAPAPD